MALNGATTTEPAVLTVVVTTDPTVLTGTVMREQWVSSRARAGRSESFMDLVNESGPPKEPNVTRKSR